MVASRRVLTLDKCYRNLVIWPLPWCKLVHIFSGDVSGYLDNYKKHRTKLLREYGIKRVGGYELPAYTTWQISFEKLIPKAATFLQLCAFMHHDDISEEIFRKATTARFKNAATYFLSNFLDTGHYMLSQYDQ
jgi:hypothetical protein